MMYHTVVDILNPQKQVQKLQNVEQSSLNYYLIQQFQNMEDIQRGSNCGYKIRYNKNESIKIEEKKQEQIQKNKQNFCQIPAEHQQISKSQLRKQEKKLDQKSQLNAHIKVIYQQNNYQQNLQIISTIGGQLIDNQINNQQQQNSYLTESQHSGKLRLFSDKILKSKINLQESQDFSRESFKQYKKQINSYQEVDSKNIPKNFSRGIFKYILNNVDDCLKIMEGISENQFLSIISVLKKNVKSIKDLREIWTGNYKIEQKLQNQKKGYNGMHKGSKKTNKNDQINNKQSWNLNQLELENLKKMLRVMSFKFLKEDCVSYFYSCKRVKKFQYILKYRQVLLKAIINPEKFYELKYY